MYRYKLNIQAEEDITRIFEYGLARFGLFLANKYYEMFFDCFSKIASNPYLFPEAFDYRAGYRYCVCGVDTIFYKINADAVEIMAIIGRQKYSI
jgi:toxin ParE1/3/4